MHLVIDRRVERDFHLVDRDAVGRQVDRLADAVLPVLLGLVEHSGNQVDVDLGESDPPGGFVRLIDFSGKMGPAVALENVVVEVFDAQAQPGDAQGMQMSPASRGLSVPGSHSKVTSSTSSHGRDFCMPLTSCVNCSGERKEGVPPPK